MTDMTIKGIGGVGVPAGAGGAGKAAGAGFDEMLSDALGKISQVQKDTETAVRELASGDVTSAIVAMEKADMTFQTMVEVRNRLINAYEEIMRMAI